VVIRDALVRTTTLNSTDGEWRKSKSGWGLPFPDDVRDQRNCDYHAGGVQWRMCPPSCQWNISARVRGVGGDVLLAVQRRDHFGGGESYAPRSASNELWYQNRGQDERIKGSLLELPITTHPFSRSVNGTEMMFPTDPLDFDITGLSAQELFQPHLTPQRQAHSNIVRHHRHTHLAHAQVLEK